MLRSDFVFRSTLEGEPWGGSEELWSQTALLLASEGYSVSASVKAWTPIHSRIKALIDHKVRTFHRGYYHYSINKITQMILKYTNVDILPYSLEKQCSLHSRLVVVSQSWLPEGLDFLSWLQTQGKRYVIITQVNADFFWPDDYMADRMYSLFSSAKKVFFVAQANYNLFIRQVGRPLANVQILYNPWHPSTSQSSIPWPDNQYLKLACVARLYTPAKGQELIIEALSQPQWSNRNLQISFVGSGEHINNLKRLATYFNVLNKVFFVGFADNISDVWKDHQALILTSRWEGSPLALIEAMRCGRPALCTAIGGMPELIEDNVTGFIAAAPTVEFVSEALERLWNNRDNLESMGQQAAKRILEIIPEHPSITLAKELVRIAFEPEV